MLWIGLDSAVLLRRSLHYIDGIVRFTRWTRALGDQALDHVGELHQVAGPKMCTTCSENGLRVGDPDVGPLRRNRADLLVVDLQKESLSVAVVPLAHAYQPSTAQRVKGMCYEHKLGRSDRRASISF
jgi:hypothetical protein